MANSDKPQRKDVWDILSVVSGLLAAVLVPIALGLVGHWYSDAIQRREVTIKEREADLKEREFARQWVEISLDILRDPESADQDRLRAWAVDVINYYTVPEINMSEDLQQRLIAGETRLPSPEASAPPSPTCFGDDAVEMRETPIFWRGRIALVVSSCAFRLPDALYRYVFIVRNLIPRPMPVRIPELHINSFIIPDGKTWNAFTGSHPPG